MKFKTTIKQTGKNTTGIEVPPEIIEALGSGKRPPVQVTLGTYSYRSTVASMDGVYMISVSEEVRRNAGVSGGDTVEVALELDTAPREVSIPDDFASALDQNAAAKKFFEGLSYSNKRRFVMGIEDAKTPETRQRRIDKAIATLGEEKV